MSPEEIAAVVGLLAVAFGRDVAPETFDVYEAALGDLEVDDPLSMVHGLLRTAERWPPPALLRRTILEASGVLPPGDAEALDQMRAYRSDPTVEVHRLVAKAVQMVGGTWALRHYAETTTIAQFRDTYRSLRAEAETSLVARSWEGVALHPGPQLGLNHAGDRRGDPRRVLAPAEGIDR